MTPEAIGGDELPEVSLCLAASLDGKIASKPDGAPDFTSRFDRAKLFRLRAESDALLIGANTVRQELLPPLVRNKKLAEARAAAGTPPHPAAAIVTASLNLPWHSPYFRKRKQTIYIVSPPPSDRQRQAMTEAGVRWIDAGEEMDLRRALLALRRHGCRRILAEGGGRLTRSLLAADLAQRLFLTMAPLVIGGDGTPTLAVGPRLDPPAWFELASCERVGDELHLEYWRKAVS